MFLTTFTLVLLPITSVPVLNGAYSSDIEPLAGIEFQGISAGRGLGIAEHDPDFHPDLVDEDDALSSIC